MKTYLDCIPCFIRHALETARMAGLNEEKQKKILNELYLIFSELSLSLSPPEVARIVNKVIQKISKKEDIYADIKQKSNNVGLRIYDKLKEKVIDSKDGLLTAVELAIIGNIIDYGAKNHLDVDKELEKMLKDEEKIIADQRKHIFNYKEFKQKLKIADNILYLGDNAGETVFDRVLIEEILSIYPNKIMIYAVKEKPVINDALREDAVICGIDKIAKVISSGSDAPGTVLSLCSKDFLAIYEKANMIISKGQGNFEALSDSKRSTFFLFIAKCSVIARNVGGNIGDIILMYKNFE